MAKLRAAKRKRLPKKSFALPGKKKYPIHDKAHAANALSRVAQHGTPAEKRAVRSAVKRKFPTLPSSKAKGRSKAAKANKPARTRRASRAGRKR